MNISKFALAGIFCLSLFSCSKFGGSDNELVSVQLEDSKMWSIMSAGNGEIVVGDEFFAPPSDVVKGAFFVENEKGEFDLYDIKDTKNRLNRSSYNVITNFNRQGFSIVRVKDEPWQIIDTKGEVKATLDKNLTVISGFSDDGLALIQNPDNLKGYVDTEGNMVIKPRYGFATVFSDGVAFVLSKIENDHSYFSALNVQGETIFTFNDTKYSDVSLFNDGYMFAVEGDHVVLVNKEGKKVMKVSNGTDLSNFSNYKGNIIYYDGQYYGVKNIEEKILLRAKYKSLKFDSDGNLLALNSNDQFGVINVNDDIIMPFDYNELYYLAPDRYISRAGKIYVIIDTKGKEVSDKAFDKFSLHQDASNRTELISSQNNEAIINELQRRYLLNLLNFGDNVNNSAPNSAESEKLSVSDPYDGPNGAIAPIGTNTYYARNMFDGNSATGWGVTLTQTDYYYMPVLRGPSFTVNGNKIDYVVIRNGYHKDKTIYNKNTRASWIRIYRDNGEEPSKEDILYEGPLSDTMSPQTLSVSPSFNQNNPNHRFAIAFSSAYDDNYYHGSKWEDLIVSELEFWGKR